MYRRPKQERQEILQISFADASSHPRTVMVLGLDAHAARIAVESTRRPDNHTGRAQRQSVQITRVHDWSMLEAIVCKEVSSQISIKRPFNFTLVFDMNTFFWKIQKAYLWISLAWYCWNYTRLGQGTQVDYAYQVKNAHQIYCIHKNTANHAKQLEDSDF